MKTWYTQPKKKGLPSFYYFNQDERELVRIRLELNREPHEGDAGQTFAAYYRNRYVGFTGHKYTSKDLDEFALDDGQMVDSYGRKLQNDPQEDLVVYDFTSENGKTPSARLHKGNPVINRKSARLPGSITESDLQTLAEVCLRRKEKIRLTDRDADPGQLADKIEEVIKNYGDRIGEVSPGRGATTSHGRWRRCCRCTII